MKRLFITLSFIAITIANALAKNYDFSSVCSSGQTLYYKITSSVAPYTVMVTYPQYYNYGMYIGDVTYYFNSTYPSGDLTIPETVTYNNTVYSVTGITEYTFYDCRGLTSVTIPNTVKSIGCLAFMYCRNIKTVNIPDSVTNIENGLFEYCDSLVSITIPNSVTEIGERAFMECVSLAEITIPDSVTSIGYEAFSNCHNLKTINIPNTVQSIGPSTFNGCDSLQYNEFDNALYLGNDENKYLWLIKAKSTDITSCKINSNCKYVYYNAFYGCNSLNYINIPNSVTTIENNAFSGCNLAYINIPKSVIYIGEKAINGLTILCEPASRPKGWYYNIYGYDYGTPLVNEWHSKTATVIWNIKATITDDYVFCATDTALRKCEIYKYIGSASDLIIPSTAYFDGVEYSVTGICDDAFDGYTFHSITIESTTPPNLNNVNAFQSYIPINVPCGSLSNYQSANTWSELNVMTTLKYSFEFSSADVEKGDVEILREPTCEKSAIIQATAETGYVFYQWSDGNKSNPRYLTVTQDTALVAYFVVDEIEAEIASANTTQGTVSNSSGTYHYNDEIEISATANYGYTFAKWSDGVTTNPRTVVLRKDTVIRAEFAVNQYTITLKTNIAERGTVSGGGTFNYLSNNKISATANTGYVFANWNDGNTANPRTVSLTCDTTFTAVFVAAECQLQVATSDEVKGSVSNSSGTYHYKDEVEISATANYGYHFTCWSDSVTANPRTVTITKDTVVRAEFAVNQYTITLKTNNAELGSIAGSGTFNYLSNNEISATANEGYVFAKWEDGNTANPRTVSLTCDTTFTAVFVAAECQLQVATSDGVKGSVSNSSGTYHYKDEVEISATANYGYHFTRWSDSVTANPRTVTITKDTVIKAEFAVNQYTITLKTNNAVLGSVAGGGTFNYLSNNEISATANEGYVFAKWEDGNTANPRTVSLTCDTAFTAVFVPAEYDLVVTSANTALGSVTGSGTIKYKEKAIVSAAVTAAHYHFNGWNDGNRQNPRTVQVLSDTAFEATFAIDSFKVSATSRAEEFGTVSGGGLYAYGTAVEVKAQPQPHCHFVEWSNGASGTVQTFNVEKDTAIAALFAIDSHRLQVASADSAKGTVIGSGNYDYGQQITVSATAAAGCYFTGWSDGTTANPRIIIIESDSTVVANFEQMLEFSITVVPSDTARGTVSGTGKYVSGTEATLSATPRQHYLFSQWSDGRTDNPRTVRVIADATYKAVFVPEQYNVVLSQNNADMGMVSGGGVYSYGDVVSCLAKPYQNYHFVQWSNGSTANPYEFVIESNQLLTAYFAAGAVTAIEDDAAAEPIIYAVGKTIVVENATNEILVYDAMGKLVCRDVACRVRAEITINTAGVYIVKTGNAVVRVVVE